MKTGKQLKRVLRILLTSAVLFGSASVASAAPPDVPIDDTNFPDQKFRDFVLEECDTDRNGSLSSDELAEVTDMNLNNEGIENLKGIEYFTHLKTLDCSSNSLTALDARENTALKTLDCSSNLLTALDVRENRALTRLDCSDNKLTALNVSANPALEELICRRNWLTELDVSANPDLTWLACSGNRLTELDVSANPDLTTLACRVNDLRTLDISANPDLKSLYCEANQLTELDVSAVPAIKEAVVHGEKDVSHSDFDKYSSSSSGELYELYVDKAVNIKTEASASFTLRFDANGHGTAPAPQTVTGGGTATKPAAPVESGWTFGGWYKEAGCVHAFDFAAPITADTTVYAKWTENSSSGGGSSGGGSTAHTVRYDLNGHGSGSIPDAAVAAGAVVPKPADPTDSMYDFGGWYREAACATAWDFASDTVSGDMTLYAKWTVKSSLPAGVCKIGFNANGGTVSPAEMLTGTDGKLSSLPVPTRSGYAFAGWFTAASGGAEVGTGTIFAADKTLYARWNRVSGGSGGGGGGGGSRRSAGASTGKGGAGNSSQSAASGSWRQDAKGWWFAYSAGGYPKNEWKQLPCGGTAWYAFDEAGYMRTGWFFSGGHWYYLSTAQDAALGKLLTGWQQTDGKWYYLEMTGNAARPQGAMYAGEKTPDGCTVDAGGAWVK